MRYVTQRINQDGQVRWYWQRTGHPLTRLPADPARRFAEQERLNRAADGRPAPAAEGSIAHIVRLYKASDAYKDLKPGTVRYYDRFLRDIEALGSASDFAASFQRRETIDFIETYPALHQRRQVRVVVKNLVAVALYRGLMQADPTIGIRLKNTKARRRIWTDDEISRWLAAAPEQRPWMRTAFLLLQFTAQRPNDVLNMAWARYNGRTIWLRQEKTDALVEVPCHPALKAHLNAMKRTGLMIVARDTGRAIKYLRFNERFRETCAAAGGLDAQARDLRRTAMVRMAEAGATIQQIAAVSGHSIDATSHILETYIPRTLQMAEAAIAKLAAYKPGSKV